jgi:NAD(P)-dependent dehydrogenase (short-subunit alcohol dehydrogenase family)
MVLTADVASASDMRAALAEVRRRFGKVDGVIHAAGVAGGGTIHRKTRSAVEAEFAAKVKGTLVLDSLLRHEKLDFFVLCSSYTAFTGGFGQVAYSAANAFQDAFAYYKSQKDPETFTVSIDWDRWRKVGMAVSVEALHKQITQEELTGGMERADGIEAFSRILSSSNSPCVIVSTRDFPSLFEKSRAAQQAPEIHVMSSAKRHARPQLLSEYVPPSTDVERSIAAIWQEELGIETLGLHDDFSELGGDSLLAIKLISRIRQALEVQLSVRILYERSTVAGLAEHIETVRWAAQTVPSGLGPGSEIDEERGSF